ASTENGTVLGVDLGVNNLAVASTGTVWTGNEFDHWRQEYENRRGDLQECGTWWAHENVQSVGHKQESRYKITLYRISNELVAEACDHGCSVIAFEDLTDIRERTGVSGNISGHSTVSTSASNTKLQSTVSRLSR
ncbi:MAG: transposase, partial [halophilic archaeon J07HX5]